MGALCGKQEVGRLVLMDLHLHIHLRLLNSLTVHLFVRNSDDVEEAEARGASRAVIPLGSIRLDPPFLSIKTWSPPQCVDMQNGTGSVALNVPYSPTKIPPLEDRQVWRILKEFNSGDPVYVEKKDSHRSYAMTTVHTSDFLPRSEIASYDHPFIAPLNLFIKIV